MMFQSDDLQEALGDSLRRAMVVGVVGPAGGRLVEVYGNYVCVGSDVFLRAQFREAISPAADRFLEIRCQEEARTFVEDNMLMISCDELGRRLNAWDSYLAGTPSHPLQTEAQVRRDTYLQVLLRGMDNWPVFIHEGVQPPRLSSHVKTCYEGFLANYPTSTSAGTVRAYYAVLSRARFRQTPQVAAFLDSVGIGTTDGVEISGW